MMSSSSRIVLADVEHGKVRGVAVEVVEPGLAGGDVSDLEIFGFEGLDEGVCDGRFVLDDQDGGHRGGG